MVQCADKSAPTCLAMSDVVMMTETSRPKIFKSNHNRTITHVVWVRLSSPADFVRKVQA